LGAAAPGLGDEDKNFEPLTPASTKGTAVNDPFDGEETGKVQQALDARRDRATDEPRKMALESEEKAREGVPDESKKLAENGTVWEQQTQALYELDQAIARGEKQKPSQDEEMVRTSDTDEGSDLPGDDAPVDDGAPARRSRKKK
jgi:hypothetical protein